MNRDEVMALSDWDLRVEGAKLADWAYWESAVVSQAGLLVDIWLPPFTEFGIEKLAEPPDFPMIVRTFMLARASEEKSLAGEEEQSSADLLNEPVKFSIAKEEESCG